MPEKFVTGATFGGPKLDILFVTTANLPVNFRTGHVGDVLPTPAGYLFQIPMNVRGVRAYLPRI